MHRGLAFMSGCKPQVAHRVNRPLLIQLCYHETFYPKMLTKVRRNRVGGALRQKQQYRQRAGGHAVWILNCSGRLVCRVFAHMPTIYCRNSAVVQIRIDKHTWHLRRRATATLLGQS